MSIRVRLSFDELVPGYSKKTWFLFDTASCRLVADLEHLIQKKFELQRNSCINLYTEGFLLPTQEKIELVRDGDIIRVEQRKKFCKDKKIAKCGDDKDSCSSKAAKKQKLDSESHRSVNGQERKKKSNQIKNAKNKGKKLEKKPINIADSNSGKGLKSNHFVKVGKPCKSNNVQKGSKNTSDMGNRAMSSSSESSSSPTSENENTGRYRKIPTGKPRKVNIVQRSSLASETTISSSENEILGNWTTNAKTAKIGSFSKQREEENASVKTSSTSSSSSTSTSSVTDWSSSSSSEDSSVNAGDKNTKPEDKKKSSSSLSSSSMLSSSSEDSSDDNKKKQHLNSKTKDKYLNINNKTKTKISPATTVYAKKQNDNPKNLSKSSNQSKNDGLNAKTKEIIMDDNAKSKATSGMFGKEKVETASLRTKSSILEKEANRNSFPTTGIFKSKSNHIQPTSISNRHIRFDSDGDILAFKENIDSSTAQDQGNDDPYDAGTTGDNNPNSRVIRENSDIPLHNGEVERNGNERMDKSMGHATATKKTAVDYSTRLSLCGPPRVGDRIAYKVLELSASYTPEMSDYKEGIVLGYDPVKNEVLIELTHDSLAKPLGDGNISTKFELIYEDEEYSESRPPVVVDRKVSVPWTSMVDPRLITSS